MVARAVENIFDVLESELTMEARENVAAEVYIFTITLFIMISLIMLRHCLPIMGTICTLLKPLII
jgi:hypothetical protein